MSTYAIEHLREASAALDTARDNVAKLEAARDALDTRASDLEAEREAKDARLADLTVDVEIGTASPEDLATLSAEVAALNTKIVDTLSARDRCTARIAAAGSKVASAEREVSRFSAVVSKPLADRLESQIRDAFRTLCRMQYDWIKLKTSDGGPPTGPVAMHGSEGDPNSFRAIAKSEGLSFEFMTAHPPPMPYTVEELTALATRDAPTAFVLEKGSDVPRVATTEEIVSRVRSCSPERASRLARTLETDDDDHISRLSPMPDGDGFIFSGERS